MARTLYSVRFIAADNINSAAGAAARRYTVPAGKVAVVRSVEMFVHTPGTLLFGLNPGGVGVLFVSTKDHPQWHVASWNGRQVFNAGDQMGGYWIDGAAGLLVSGYLLSTV